MPETSAPLITIGITCYNAAETIERAIKSACSQNWPNTEIIIVDDASTDNSPQIIKHLIKDLPHTLLITHSKNKGPAGARNTLINNAKGEFLAFFDDDDEAKPERIKTQYKRISAYEIDYPRDIIMCFASGIRIYPNGHHKKLNAPGSQDNKSIPRGNPMADRLLFYGGPDNLDYGFGPPTCALMARISSFKTAGGFDENFRRVEDVDLAVRVSLAGGHFIGCPEELFIQHATLGSDKAPAKNLQAEQQLAYKYKSYLLEKKKYHYALLWPKVRYHHFMREYSAMALAILNVMRYHPIKAPLQLLNTGLKRLWHEHKIRQTKT